MSSLRIRNILFCVYQKERQIDGVRETDRDNQNQRQRERLMKIEPATPAQPRMLPLDQSFQVKRLSGKSPVIVIHKFLQPLSPRMSQSNFCLLCKPTSIFTNSNSYHFLHNGLGDPVHLDSAKTASLGCQIVAEPQTMYFTYHVKSGIERCNVRLSYSTVSYNSGEIKTDLQKSISWRFESATPAQPVKSLKLIFLNISEVCTRSPAIHNTHMVEHSYQLLLSYYSLKA